MSRIPPLPDYAIMCDCGANCFTADQLRARDGQIVEACIAEVERLRSSGENSDKWTITRDLAFHESAAAIRSLLGEGEGKE